MNETEVRTLLEQLNMKVLKLTILLEANTSKATLANTFGEFVEISKLLNYLQFSFDHVRMLTSLQLSPIHSLIESYEKQHHPLQFKMLHLYDDVDGTYSPISLQYYKGNWTVVSSVTGAEMHTSTNLLTLI